MTAFPFSFSSDSLSESERIDRIAFLLCKAVMLAEAKRKLELPTASLTQPDDPAQRVHIDDRILSYLRVSGAATPLAIRDALGLARTTAYRSFTRLQQAGHIQGLGRASALVYHLNQREPAPEKIELN